MLTLMQARMLPCCRNGACLIGGSSTEGYGATTVPTLLLRQLLVRAWNATPPIVAAPAGGCLQPCRGAVGPQRDRICHRPLHGTKQSVLRDGASRDPSTKVPKMVGARRGLQRPRCFYACWGIIGEVSVAETYPNAGPRWLVLGPFGTCYDGGHYYF